jgi:hypothetical protein
MLPDGLQLDGPLDEHGADPEKRWRKSSGSP